jgi:hypothetical protein
MFTQHLVRHRNFRGQASAGLYDLTIGAGLHGFPGSPPEDYVPLPQYNTSELVTIDSEGNVNYDSLGGQTVYDVRAIFDFLVENPHFTYRYDFPGVEYIDGTISDFQYTNDSRLSFSYDASLVFKVGEDVFHRSYRFFFDSGDLHVVLDGVHDNWRYLHMGPASYGILNYVSDDGFGANFVCNPVDRTQAFGIAIPYGPSSSVAEHLLSVRLDTIAQPFWQAVELNQFEITALSRDTTTVALNRLSQQAYEPNVGRIRSVNVLKISGDSLLAKTAGAGLQDAQLMSLKKIMSLTGSAKLVKYRTLFSDVLQLIDSLEVLGAMKNTPSRLYVDSAVYDYPVILGGRDCVIRVRTKAYLELSPFRLLQILAGKKAVVILNDLLALYYSSIPLGEILLTILQLRRIGDYISNRMFYDLPLFFVHSYTVESQLTQADLDYTGMSNVPGSKARLTYYIRDVSQHLPVLRYSKLSTFYGTGDVGNIVWSLLQQLAGVLSSSN